LEKEIVTKSLVLDLQPQMHSEKLRMNLFLKMNF